MSRLLARSVLLALSMLAVGSARADEPGRFDYYLLSLSWSPQYCASEARPNDPQCARPYAFVVHGLWPQHERGWPSDCGRGEYLSDSLIADALRFMPSKSLVIHEWRKHGVCSGLGARQYFETAERAYRSITIPAAYSAPGVALTRTVQALERDLLKANPALRSDGIAVQCSGRYLREVQICLSRDLKPRACGSDVRDRCKGDFVLRPSR
ncbi:MAG: ribonuclease T2 [Pseudomonadota bacterium]